MSRQKITLVVAASLLSLSSCSALAAEQVRVAVSSTSLFFASAYVAKQMGYFDKAGLDLSIIDVGSGSNVIASVVGGSAEIGIAGIRNISQGIEKGQSLKAFGSSLKGFPNFLVVRKGFFEEAGLKPESPFTARIASLKGKTVAVNDIGGSAGDFVRELLRRGGLGERDAVLINISSASGPVGGIEGEADRRTGRICAGAGDRDARGLRRNPDQLGVRHAGDQNSIAYIMHFTRSRFLQDKRPVAEAYIACVGEGRQADEGRDRGRARRLLCADVGQVVRREDRSPACSSCNGRTCVHTSRPPWRSLRRVWPEHERSSTSRAR